MPSHSGQLRQHGFTVVEMMLSLASTALIGLAIASMLTAVSYGTKGSKDARTLVVKCKSVNSRVSAAVRQSAVVLAANTADDDGDDWIILWAPGGEVAADAPKTSELHRIEFSSGEIRSYRNTSPATDTTYALTDDFESIISTLITDGTFDEEVWATDVDDVVLRLDEATVQDAGLVSYRLTFRAGDITETAVSAAALRNREVASAE